MNKSFEQAYRELAETEAPELWERIEEGLQEKTTSSSKTVNIEEKKKEKGELKKRTGQFSGYVKIAAALFCVLMAAPALSLLQRASGEGKSASDQMVLEEREEIRETAEGAPEKSTVETAEGGRAEEAPEAALMMAETAPEERKKAVEEIEAGKESADALSEEEKALTESAQTDQAEKEEKEALRDVTVLSEKQPQLTELAEEGAGNLYTVRVVQDPSGILQEGEEIQIFIPVYSSFMMDRAEYTLDLLPYGEGSCFQLYEEE